MTLSSFPSHFLVAAAGATVPFRLVTQPPASLSTDLHNGGGDDLIGAQTLSHAPIYCAPDTRFSLNFPIFFLFLYVLAGIYGRGVLGSPTLPASVLGVQLIYLLGNFT